MPPTTDTIHTATTATRSTHSHQPLPTSSCPFATASGVNAAAGATYIHNVWCKRDGGEWGGNTMKRILGWLVCAKEQHNKCLCSVVRQVVVGQGSTSTPGFCLSLATLFQPYIQPKSSTLTNPYYQPLHYSIPAVERHRPAHSPAAAGVDPLNPQPVTGRTDGGRTTSAREPVSML